MRNRLKTQHPPLPTSAYLKSYLPVRLYRTEYGTFEDYCKERWGMARNYANKLIVAAGVIENLGTTVPTPESERQARPLAKLPPEQQADAWTAAVEVTNW